jgi:hypothetical protein
MPGQLAGFGGRELSTEELVEQAGIEVSLSQVRTP